MQISAVTQNNAAVNVAPAAPRPQKTLVQQPQAQKVDNVMISEKAKDMAARQSGQAYVEEAKESLSAKALEAPENRPGHLVDRDVSTKEEAPAQAGASL
jgi:hypothetical protein